jgi:RNA polymerase sigma-70 factor, ECF subfamily
MSEAILEQAFLDDRPRLFQLAYRMMGAVSDAEDALQDVFVRLKSSKLPEVHAPRSYLTRAVVRRCLDQWKSARHKREHYVGPWLPEPLSARDDDPASRHELAESVSVAFLVVLEALTPVERAVFLLHEVFQYSFDELAVIVDKTPAACRQIGHRAREKVRENRPRFAASPEQHREMVGRFMNACRSGDLADLQALLAENVTVVSDGGGLTPAARVPVIGIDRVTRFVLGLRTKAQRFGVSVVLKPCEVNGKVGIMQIVDGRLHAVISLEVSDGRIQRLFSVLNPHKLVAIAKSHNLEGV